MKNLFLRIGFLWSNGYLIDGQVPYEYIFYHKILNLSVGARNKKELISKFKKKYNGPFV